MSDKVDNTVREVEAGHNITRAVNDGMSRDEQLEFARKLWDNGGSASAKGTNEFSKTFGDAEITFRRGKDGEREVSDIVFGGTKDLYDTPEQQKARGAERTQPVKHPSSPGFGAPGDDRYRGPAPTAPEGSRDNPNNVRERLGAQRKEVGTFNIHEKKALEDLAAGK